MPDPRRTFSNKATRSSRRQSGHDFLEIRSGGKDRGKPSPTGQTSSPGRGDALWPPVLDLFDVITYFRARGDSFTLIASIGFWIGETPKKALTARALKLWYEAELDRREAAKATIR
jgi:hypothetical protein